MQPPFPEEDLDATLDALVLRRRQEDLEHEGAQLQQRDLALDQEDRGEAREEDQIEVPLREFLLPQEGDPRYNPNLVNQGLGFTGAAVGNAEATRHQQRLQRQLLQLEKEREDWRAAHAYLEHAEVQLLHRGDPGRTQPIPLAPLFLRAKRLAELPPLREAPPCHHPPYRRPLPTPQRAAPRRVEIEPLEPYVAPSLRAVLSRNTTRLVDLTARPRKLY